MSRQEIYRQLKSVYTTDQLREMNLLWPKGSKEQYLNALNQGGARKKTKKYHEIAEELPPQEAIKFYEDLINELIQKHASYRSIHAAFSFMVKQLVKKYKIIIGLTDEFGQTINYTMSSKFLKKLRKYLNPRYKPRRNEGSDIDLTDIVMHRGATEHITLELIKRSKISQNAGFFNYINTSELDLSRLQIFNKEQVKETKKVENCLVHCLREYCEEHEIDDLKTLIHSDYVCRRNLKDIADKLGKCIKVCVMDSKRNQYYYYGSRSNSVIDINLFQNHYFLQVKIPITPYALRNIKEDFMTPDKYMIDSQGKLRTKERYWVYSRKVVETLYKKNYFKRSPMMLKFGQSHHSDVDPNYHLDNITTELFEKKVKLGECENKNIYFADYETVPTNKHVAFMLGIKKMNGKTKIYHNTTERELEKNTALFECLDYIEKQYYKELDELNTIEVDNYRWIKEYYEKYQEAEKQYNKIVRKKNKLNEFMKLDLSDEEELDCKVLEEEINDREKHFRNLKTLIKMNNKKKINSLIGPIVYFHNVKFDFNFIEPFCNVLNVCKKDGQLFSATILYKKIRIVFKDSYKMISHKLSEFQKNFKLDVGKLECIPYNFYTIENVLTPYVNKEIFKERMNQEFDKKDYKPLIKPYLFDGLMDHLGYMEDYLIMDCEVLHDGFLKFRESILGYFNVDAFNYLSLASMADSYAIANGCYEGVHELKGNTMKFVQSSIMGGRVSTRKSKKYILEAIMQDFDAVSLYPSAMKRLIEEGYGFPVGKPIKINKKNDGTIYSEIPSFLNLPYFIIRIKITAINKKQQIPFISYLEDGKRIYTNRIMNNFADQILTVDKITLEDWIRWHEIEFIFIEGIYWTRFNNKISEVIQRLFQGRLDAKADRNDILQLSIKCLMNTIYGRTALKPSKTRQIYVNEDKFDLFISKKYNVIREYYKIGSKYCVTLYNNNFRHSNRAHCAGIILSMSKRIMNEVMGLANDLGLKIYYMDTDSMHILDDDVKILAEEYEKEYGRTLINKGMGGFHADLEIGGVDAVATKTVILGKKCYYDQIETPTVIKNEPEILQYCEENNIRIFEKNEYCLEILSRDLPPEYEEMFVVYNSDLTSKLKSLICRPRNNYQSYITLEELKEIKKESFEPLAFGKKSSHVRMKGVGSSPIKSNLRENETVYDFYLSLYNGEEREVDLCKGGVKFEQKNGYIRTRKSFIRKVKF